MVHSTSRSTFHLSTRSQLWIWFVNSLIVEVASQGNHGNALNSVTCLNSVNQIRICTSALELISFVHIILFFTFLSINSELIPIEFISPFSFKLYHQMQTDVFHCNKADGGKNQNTARFYSWSVSSWALSIVQTSQTQTTTTHNI